MNILIIGGGGFLGQKLAKALAARGRLRDQPIAKLTLADLAAPAAILAAFPVITCAADVTDKTQVETLMQDRPDVIYHLAAVVSGQAEAEFDLGMTVNLFGSINVFEAVRALGTNPVLIFTSSIAVYGGEAPDPIEDWTFLNPQTSYGAEKAAAEVLLNDYARKGFFDGRALRLPTISIRPGKPNKAASSFMSSIFREPLQGEEAVCPVSPDYEHWFLSPRRCVENLIIGAEIPSKDWGQNRCIMLPGRTHKIGDMVEAMRRVEGDAAVNRIRWEPDQQIQDIVHGWRGRFNPEKALRLGFVRDDSFEDNIRYFLEDDIERPALKKKEQIHEQSASRARHGRKSGHRRGDGARFRQGRPQGRARCARPREAGRRCLRNWRECRRHSHAMSPTPASVEAMFQRIGELHGRLDVLVQQCRHQCEPRAISAIRPGRIGARSSRSISTARS